MTTSSCLPGEPALGPSVMPCSVTSSPAYMARMSWLHRTRLLPTTLPRCTLQAADLPPGLLSPPPPPQLCLGLVLKTARLFLLMRFQALLSMKISSIPALIVAASEWKILLRIFKIPHLRSPALLSPTAGLCATKAERFLCFNLLTVCVSLS